ncbi:hypothetical protein DOTSEDRAFT_80803 [Dothistroma septosporum NZE10]|uniref:Uncharacterized protein n=1 Tax=Dothistroma septosporum (strain NZE10 / CBS 128990) TaxID=675120 RepID=M2WN08_DOTSN|nr:hypothetical protein DOTSEDRAFT_80803 [Dothistroma septosporum NZE10]
MKCQTSLSLEQALEGRFAAQEYLELASGSDVIILEAVKESSTSSDLMCWRQQRATLGGVWAGENLVESLKTNNLYGTYKYSGRPTNPTVYDVHFSTKVKEIEKLDDGWESRTNGPAMNKPRSIAVPNRVNLTGAADFERPVLNHGELRETVALANAPNITAVTVVGASKIGYMPVYMFAARGNKVDWAIRKSGGGAIPCWSARVGVLNNNTNVHDLNRSGQVTIHQSDIALSQCPNVHYDDGAIRQTDAVVQITCWQLTPTISWKPAGIDASLGIPGTACSPSDHKSWNGLYQQADTKPLQQYPRLNNPPARTFPLTQSITPDASLQPRDRPIKPHIHQHCALCFFTMVYCTSNLVLIETQAL